MEDEMNICKKAFFINEDFAEQYITKLKKTSIRDRKPIRAYLCQKCFNWHLTSIEDKNLTYLKRQIDNLKNKVLHLEKENDKLKQKTS